MSESSDTMPAGVGSAVRFARAWLPWAAVCLLALAWGVLLRRAGETRDRLESSRAAELTLSLELHRRDMVRNPSVLHLLEWRSAPGREQSYAPAQGVVAHVVAPPAGGSGEDPGPTEPTPVQVYNSMAAAQACLLASDGEVSPRVHFVLADVLAQLSPDSRASIAAMLERLQDSDDRVRDAFHALYQELVAAMPPAQQVHFREVVLAVQDHWRVAADAADQPFRERALALVQANRFGDARDLAEQHQKQHPEDPSGYWYAGVASFGLRDWPAAISALKQASELSPDLELEAHRMIHGILKQMASEQSTEEPAP